MEASPAGNNNSSNKKQLNQGRKTTGITVFGKQTVLCVCSLLESMQSLSALAQCNGWSLNSEVSVREVEYGKRHYGPTLGETLT